MNGVDIRVADPSKLGPAASMAVGEIEKCVHCGFCNAACPTYAITRDERDGPRGRIHLAKELLEGNGDAATVQRHLDRCLTCRSCESACPSGVGYSKVAHAGRKLADSGHGRKVSSRLGRFLLCESVRSAAACHAGRVLTRLGGPLAPRRLRKMLPKPTGGVPKAVPANGHSRTVSVLQGCGPQRGLMPETNRSLGLLLAAAGYNARTVASPCCGALRAHLGRHKGAARDMGAAVASCRRGIDEGDEAVLAAASGCASFMTEYPNLAKEADVPEGDASAVAAKVRDPASFLAGKLGEVRWSKGTIPTRVATHLPCTLVNGLRSPKAYPGLLEDAGLRTVAPEGPPNCCGSAGTYSVLNPGLSEELGRLMAASVEATGAQMVASANIGCIMHMRRFVSVPVRHWLDLLAEKLPGAGQGAP